MTAPSSFGIVGCGALGAMLADSLAVAGEVRTYDLASTPGRTHAPLADVSACDLVICAVPDSALRDAVGSIVPLLGDNSVVMDTVSSKVNATATLAELLPGGVDYVASHPLFGPPSMSSITPGLRLVVTDVRGGHAEAVLVFFAEQFGVDIVRMTSEEHDRSMAYILALPLFIARVLDRMEIDRMPLLDKLSIPSFEKLVTLAAIERFHSDGMFLTSQCANPFAADMREAFSNAVVQLRKDLNDGVA